MSAQMIVELPSGAKIHFGKEPPKGLAEVGVAEDVARIAGDKFKAALGALADLVAALEDSVGHMSKRPDKIEMEFGASLSGECDLWVVSGEGKADFKVKLAWGK
jgi:NTP-dependent ternary system trypsin peptidase co-occuring protein